MNLLEIALSVSVWCYYFRYSFPIYFCRDSSVTTLNLLFVLSCSYLYCPRVDYVSDGCLVPLLVQMPICGCSDVENGLA